MESMRDRLGVALEALLTCTAIGGAEAADSYAETRAARVENFEALNFVLPLSLSDERFEDPAQRKPVRSPLAAARATARSLAGTITSISAPTSTRWPEPSKTSPRASSHSRAPERAWVRAPLALASLSDRPHRGTSSLRQDSGHGRR